MHDLDALWESAPPPGPPVEAERIDALPEPARRLLLRAAPPGTPRWSAVRLEMRGEIRLNGAWCPFAAWQVLRPDRGMLWRARVRRGGLTIEGYDRLVDGAGEMLWKLFGLFPVVRASGPDTTRSAAGRAAGERVWLPTALVDLPWSADDAGRAVVRVPSGGIETDLALTVAGDGRIEAVVFPRWGNPDGGAFGTHPFGGAFAADRTFGGVTIPTEMRLGWHAGTDRAQEGEFFRATIDRAEFR